MNNESEIFLITRATTSARHSHSSAEILVSGLFIDREILENIGSELDNHPLYSHRHYS